MIARRRRSFPDQRPASPDIAGIAYDGAVATGSRPVVHGGEITRRWANEHSSGGRARQKHQRCACWRVLAASAQHGDVSVVITHQTMPGMTGLIPAEHVRSLRPRLPIILSTGDTGRVTAESLQDDRFDSVLDTPYALLQPTGAIEGALRAARRRETPWA